MEFTTGSYVGDGIDDRWINDPGFQPDVVVVKADAAQYAVFSTSSMAADKTAYFANNVANFSNGIQSFGANGFQVGTHSTVNANGVTYCWAAFRDDGAGDLDVGNYTGDGTDSRNLDIVGFQPTILWIKRDGANSAVWRVDEVAGDDTLFFRANSMASNRIQTFRPVGFQVGSDNAVNAAGQVYYYVAFLDTGGFIETGSYTGNGVDDRSVAVGFEPDLVFVKGDSGDYAVLRVDTMDSGDSGPHLSVTPAPNQIQAFEAAGFQVGTHARVNSGGVDYYWAAWRSGATGSTTTTTSTTTVTTTTTTTTTTTSSTVTATTTLYPEPVGSGPILKVTDGTDEVSLIKRGGRTGYHLCGWTPQVADYKRGGTWQDSPIAEGRRLAHRLFGNVVETFDLTSHAWDVDSLIRESQDIRRLLEKAADYWAQDWQNEPVWIEARARCEGGARYAILHKGRIPQDGNPYSQPFLGRRRSAMRNLTLVVERGHWQDLPPERHTPAGAFAVGGYQGRFYGNVDENGAREPSASRVYVANKRNMANITHIFLRDGAGAWSGNLVGGGVPFRLFSATPVVNDRLFFGVNTALSNSGPFCSLVFDLLQGQTDVTEIIWEYWNGAWVQIPTLYDDTINALGQSLGQAGLGSVAWAQPSDWITRATHGVTGYWVRARVATVGAAPQTPWQQNRDVYSVTWPHVELDDATVGGDIPALVKWRLTGRGFEADRVIAGLRSMQRGEDFTAYINLADEQNPTGITVTVGGNCAFANNMGTATGREIYYTAGGNGTITVRLSGAICGDYYGIYHGYIRGKQEGGYRGDTTFDVVVILGSGQVEQTPTMYSVEREFEFVPDVDWYVVDLGRIEISPPSLLDDPESYDINDLEFTIGGTQDARFYELVLIPIDEWAAEFVDPEAGATVDNCLRRSRRLEFEAVQHPKRWMRAMLRELGGRIVGRWSPVSNGPAILQANADQRVWLMAVREETSRPEVLSSMAVEIVQRYLSMRGDR